jgi:NAD(P)-dependent dehydrogenase (short-subunit alcohol dehydrogenase family)
LAKIGFIFNPMLYIITGHSRGLGLALAKAALAEGGEVRGLSRKKANMPDHPKLFQFEADLSQAANWQPAAAFALKDIAQYDGVTAIFNAGVLSPIGPVGSGIDPVGILKAIQLNVTSIMAMTEVFVQKTAQLNIDKRIVFISSGAGRSPRQAWSTYCSTKAAVICMLPALQQNSRAIQIPYVLAALPRVWLTPICKDSFASKAKKICQGFLVLSK